MEDVYTQALQAAKTSETILHRARSAARFAQARAKVWREEANRVAKEEPRPDPLERAQAWARVARTETEEAQALVVREMDAVRLLRNAWRVARENATDEQLIELWQIHSDRAEEGDNWDEVVEDEEEMERRGMDIASSTT